MLLDERQPVEARARDDDLEVVAAARAVDDRELAGVRERLPQKGLEPVDRHAPQVSPRAPRCAGPAPPRARRARRSRRGARTRAPRAPASPRAARGPPRART